MSPGLANVTSIHWPFTEPSTPSCHDVSFLPSIALPGDQRAFDLPPSWLLALIVLAASSWTTWPPDPPEAAGEPGTLDDGDGLEPPRMLLLFSPAAIAKPAIPATIRTGTRMTTQTHAGRPRTVRRFSTTGVGATSGVPHDLQNRRVGSLSVWHAGQMIPVGSCGLTISSGGLTTSISVRVASRCTHGVSMGWFEGFVGGATTVISGPSSSEVSAPASRTLGSTRRPVVGCGDRSSSGWASQGAGPVTVAVVGVCAAGAVGVYGACGDCCAGAGWAGAGCAGAGCAGAGDGGGGMGPAVGAAAAEAVHDPAGAGGAGGVAGTAGAGDGEGPVDAPGVAGAIGADGSGGDCRTVVAGLDGTAIGDGRGAA